MTDHTKQQKQEITQKTERRTKCKENTKKKKKKYRRRGHTDIGLQTKVDDDDDDDDEQNYLQNYLHN